MASAELQLENILKRLGAGIKDAVNRTVMNRVGSFTVNLIVKRTRLGYGVDRPFAQKQKLKRLSEKYIRSREAFDGLSPTTTPNKSNLTRTGQMLASMKYKIINRSTIEISPTGTRDDGLTNAEVAAYQAEQGRIFNNVSLLEFKQIRRFYRKNYGDLLRKRKLIK